MAWRINISDNRTAAQIKRVHMTQGANIRDTITAAHIKRAVYMSQAADIRDPRTVVQIKRVHMHKALSTLLNAPTPLSLEKNLR